MEGKRLRFEDPEPVWCSAPIALGVGRESQRRVLYYSRERLMLHSPVFERMLAESDELRESEPNAVIELPNDDPKEFDNLLRLIAGDFDAVCDRGLCLASRYLMEDAIRFFDCFASMKANDVSNLSRLIRCIDDASLPRTKALVFREVCMRQRLDEVRNDGVWTEIPEILRLELTEHCYDDQRKANGRKGFYSIIAPVKEGSCSIVVPEIQWPSLLTFESPAPEHCGGVTSLRLIVGRSEEKRVLHCSKEIIYSRFPALRERLQSGGDSLELEDDRADGFVHYMNWALFKRPWSAFSVHQQSAILCLENKYQADIDFYDAIESSKQFTLCHKLYLAEQCHLDDLQKKYLDEICGSTAKFDGARKSEWWLQLSDRLQLALMNRIIQKIDLSAIRF